MLHYKQILISCSLLLCLINGQAQKKALVSVHSPNKTTQWEMRVNDQQQLEYRVSYKKKPITNWSPLGLVVNGLPYNEKVTIGTSAFKTHHKQFDWPLGEDAVITNHYNELTVNCKVADKNFRVITRAYEGSIGFRYEGDEPGEGMINAERTAFHFPVPYTIYQYNHESVFTPGSIDTVSKTCDLPATLTNGKYYLSIGEADNTTYTKAELKKGAEPHSLAVTFSRDKAVVVSSEYRTPWRTISIAESAIGLHACSQLYLKLASNPVPAVPAWIKPGKLIRSQLTTQSGLDCIDFAAAHQFQYILFDAGWYGPEFRGASDPTQVIPEIDLPKVIDYGKEKGIGVILYVNYVGLRARLDTILPLYKQWGVAGLKFGFVDGFTQQGLTWLSGAMKKVYDHGLILNIHDNYKPTGLSRAFPQLLTQEGIRGDENSPDAFHNTVLPFTRFLAGPADFTFCFPNPQNTFSKNIKVSKAQQLALTVVYFSPLQAIFWYGKPRDYTNEGEIEFFNHVPTVWDESQYLAGEIGRNIAVVRRRGDTWFLGMAAGFDSWQYTLRFDFLEKGKGYTATVYEDDEQGGIRKRTFTVKKGQQVPFQLSAKGGKAMIIRPQ